MRGGPVAGRGARALAGMLLAGALAVAGCSGGGASGDGDAGGDSRAGRPAAGDDGKGGAAGPGAERPGSAARESVGRADGRTAGRLPDAAGTHLIRTASLRVRVKDVADALDAARAAARDAGGIVGDETTDRDGEGRESSRIVLRVPRSSYDEVLAALAGTGTLVERKVKARDVSEQVVDVDSRVESQRASVARVRALMDDAKRISDVVALEGELSTREADLESLLARQASLKDRTSMATITLRLSQRAGTAPGGHEEESGFTDALGGGWDVFVTIARGVALAVGAALPFLAAGAVTLVLWRLFRGRLPRRARPAAAGASPAWHALAEPRGGATPEPVASAGPAEPAGPGGTGRTGADEAEPHPRGGDEGGEAPGRRT
ncbi:hypothetical protein B1H18_11925 [Streptomyces tsukubensis]|uniref:DUF4349 domain-containing protein n=1 Tax=Streptomyces tsukubensis TaxID=83656 RepID=A0A1V4AAM7_9ACTN|nr:hypothetical protein B1H18_11925 [Streptomyces tsukubensis]